MPELPEVESVVRSLCSSSSSLIGRRIEQGFIHGSRVISGCSAEEFLQRLQHACFTRIERHGKYLFFEMQPGCATTAVPFFLVIHLRMTGRLYLVPVPERSAKYTRLSLILSEQLALRFDDPRTFGRAWLVEHPSIVTSTLGPDALTVTVQEFTTRLAGSKRQLKPLLLDQSFVAGIGNIYADEILFRSRLHPLTNSRNLAPNEVHRLHQAVRTVLEEAVEAHGANIDGVFKAGNFIVSVYGRSGKKCRICESPILRITVGQRGTHFCPECQRRK